MKKVNIKIVREFLIILLVADVITFGVFFGVMRGLLTN